MSKQAQKTPQAVAQKWSTNLASAGPAMQAGVQAVQTAPGQLAANNVNGYVQGVQANVQKWATNTAAVSLQSWQQSYLNKAVIRVTTAATTDKGKVQAAMTSLLPYVYNLRSQINSSNPRGNLQQNIQRSAAFIQGMANYKPSGM